MKNKPLSARKQKGIALVMFLVALVLGGAYAFYRSANISFGSTQQDAKLTLTLARAKEALIAYAVIDDKRPGRMLCPDIVGDGISPLLSRDDCDGWGSGGPDVYSGWLPWKTLDLVEPSDDRGIKFRYVASRFFGGDRSSPALNSGGELIPPSLNSDTPTSLHVDVPAGSPSNDVVAVIIATRGPLDTRNADVDEYFYSGSSKNPEDNDVLAVITRQELMAAVEKRIAAEVKNCLEQHAQHAGNPGTTYPWPAPLSNAIFKGQAGSLFGMVPATQPGNPDETLKTSLNQLQNAKNTLESASTAAAQVEALQAVTQATGYAGGLADRIYIVAARVAEAAKEVRDDITNDGDGVGLFMMLKNTLSALTASTPAYNAGKATLPGTIAAALPELATFRNTLSDSGFDVFLVELEKQNAALKSRIDTATASPTRTTLGALQTQANVLRRTVLGSAYTPDPALEALRANAYAQADRAVDAARTARATPTDTGLVDLALLGARELFDADVALAATLRASRLNLDPDEITYLQRILRKALDDFALQPGATLGATLAQALQTARRLVADLSGSPTVRAARDLARTALDEALLATTEPLDARLLVSRSETAIARLEALESAMRNNGDNFVLETLKNIEATLGAVTSPPASRTAANTLLTPIDDVLDWASLAQAYAEDIARNARKGVGAASDSDTSVFTAARRTVSSIDGETGSSQLLQEFIADPSNEAKRTAAQTALSKTLGQLATLLDTGSQLEAMLESSLAQAATPTAWLGEACAFLQAPLSGTIGNRWHDNQWANYIFYQISDRVRPAVGKFSVNGAGTYRVVVLAAGAGLPALNQNRSLRETRSFLEAANIGYNAVSGRYTRDRDATTPDTTFASGPPLATFNDRLAY
jgi:hypothetical protein